MKACGLSLYRIALPLLLMTLSAQASEHGMIHASNAAGAVSVSDAYVRAMPPGQANSTAFMTLSNGSATHHTLVGAKTSAAKMAQLHTHMEMEGMMKMRKIEKIDIQPHGEAVLKPGGLHVMLMGLKSELKAGDSVSITLVFGDGSKKEIQAPVKKMKMEMDMKGHDQGQEMKHEMEKEMQHEQGRMH